MTKEDAASALAEVQSARGRAARLQRYRDFAPHAVIWGSIWVVANTAIDLLGSRGNLVWLVLTIVGACASMIVGARRGRQRLAVGEHRDGHGARWAALGFGLFAYFQAVLSILAPTVPAQVGSYIALTFSAAYVFVGIFSGWKIALLGLVMSAAILAGYHSGLPHLQILSGAVAGLAMIIGGLWMQRA
jgi:hypothetical protein